MTLTDARCRNEKPGEARKKLSDGRGLQLWVQTNGTKLWQLVYRFQGRQRQVALGPYPDVSLSEARAKRDEAKALLRAGTDPVAHWKPAAPPKLVGETFQEVAGEYRRRS